MSHQPTSQAPIRLFVLADFLVLGVSASFRHLSGHSSFFDLGVMDNCVWQTLHGRLFFYPQYDISYFGDHFAPILFLFVPMYAIRADPLVLILGQALALAIGGWFVYQIAYPHFQRGAWGFTAMYALHPSVLHVAMFDFHPVALMIPLSLAAYYCYLTRRWIWLSVSLVLLAACQEEAAITVAAFGLYMLVFGRPTVARWIGAATIMAGTLYFIIVMKVIIPAFQPSTTGGWVYLSRYGHLGGSMGEMVLTMPLHPVDALVRSFELYKLETLLWLFLPLGLLPLLGWRALLVALPGLAYTYLSARSNQFRIQYQYFSPALGWLVVATVQGQSVWSGLWKRLAPRLAPRQWQVVLGLPLALALVAAIAIDIGLSPIKLRFFGLHPFRKDLDILHRIIGPEASVSVTNRLAPSFAHRREYYLALDFILNRDVNAALGLPDYRGTLFHLFDLTAFEGSQDRERRVARLLKDEHYGVRYYRFPLVLFERGFARRAQPELEALLSGVGEEGPGVVRAFPAVFLSIRDAGAVERDLGVGGQGAVMRFLPGRRGRVAGPGITLPAGSYAVDFHMTLETRTVALVADLEVISSPADRRRSGLRRLTAEDFTGVRCQPFTLPVELPDETAGVQFRTRSYGAALSLCKVVVRNGSVGADGASMSSGRRGVPRTVGEPPADEPGAEQSTLRDRPEVMIEDTDDRQRRQAAGDQAVPQIGRALAPATVTNRQKRSHHPAYEGQPDQTELGPDQERNIVNGVEHDPSRRHGARRRAEVSGTDTAERMVRDEAHGDVHQAAAVGGGVGPEEKSHRRNPVLHVAMKCGHEDHERDGGDDGEPITHRCNRADERPRAAEPRRGHGHTQDGGEQAGAREGAQHGCEQCGPGDDDEAPVAGAPAGPQPPAKDEADRQVAGQHIGVWSQPVRSEK